MDDLDAIDKGDGLHKFFKLESTLSTTNMVLFDQDGQITKWVYFWPSYHVCLFGVGVCVDAPPAVVEVVDIGGGGTG